MALQRLVAPEYSSDLYRLYFLEEKAIEAVVGRQTYTIEPGSALAISFAEQAVVNPNARLRSLAFHHDFFV